MSNVTLAVGSTYPACTNLCGSGDQAFDGVSFSQQLVAWLALILQLPTAVTTFLNFSNLCSSAIGSPILAGYSLALAVTTNRWMVERFERSNYPNSFFAAKVASSLQQVLFSLPKEDHVLWPLVVLRENDQWWRRLASGLDHSSSRWTLAAIMSMMYVGLTYILTWITTLYTKFDQSYYLSGQIFGSLWLSLLPLVVCYLQLSLKSHLERINATLDHTNKLCFVAERGEPTQCPFQTTTTQTACRRIIDEEVCPTPVCFYARFYARFQIALQLFNAFDVASQRTSAGGTVPRTRPEIVEYLSTDGDADDRRHYDLANIYVKSAMLAISLQCRTTCAAIVALYFTPTRGLGCFSGSLLLYVCVSTLIWLCLALSSVLGRIFATSQKDTRLRRFRFIGGLAVTLRQTGNLLAAINIAWIFASAFLQFSNAERIAIAEPQP